jgi:hypothetical protein
MNANKAAYWIALGVLALGLNSEYRHGNFVALHRITGHADSLLCQMSTRAAQTLAFARLLSSREAQPADALLGSTDAAELARDQAEAIRERALDRSELVGNRVRDQLLAQADAMRLQVEMQRDEIEQIRARTRARFSLVRTVNPRVTIVCPKTGKRVVVNDAMDSADISPDIEIQDNF